MYDDDDLNVDDLLESEEVTEEEEDGSEELVHELEFESGSLDEYEEMVKGQEADFDSDPLS